MPALKPVLVVRAEATLIVFGISLAHMTSHNSKGPPSQKTPPRMTHAQCHESSCWVQGARGRGTLSVVKRSAASLDGTYNFAALAVDADGCLDCCDQNVENVLPAC